MGKLITKTIDQCKLTPADIRRAGALAANPDSEIDFSDIPELEWKHPIGNPFYTKLTQSCGQQRESD